MKERGKEEGCREMRERREMEREGRLWGIEEGRESIGVRLVLVLLLL